MTKERINRALRSLGLEIQANRADGYAYFTSRKTGHQIGESVFVCYLKSYTVQGWKRQALRAIRTHRENGFRLHRHSQKI